MTMKHTKKQFQEYLNKIYPYNVVDNNTNCQGKHGQIKRAYGDYLRQADPIMFNVNFKEWKAQNEK